MTISKDTVASRCDTEPVAAITDIVLAVEPTMSQAEAERAVLDVVTRRDYQRELARALTAAPDLLTSGRPEGPRSVERLIRALLAHGARQVVLPRCPRCGNARPLLCRDGDLRICNKCSHRAASRNQPCAGCGKPRITAYRDHLGQPWCQYCRPGAGTPTDDPLRELVEIVCSIEPGMPQQAVIDAISEAIPLLSQIRQTAGALRDAPDLLTGRGAHGSPRVIALIGALVSRGAANVVAPPCTICGVVKPLRSTLHGLRCCRHCYQLSNQKACADCGQVRSISFRTMEGRLLCRPCSNKQPSAYDDCASCGRRKRIVTRAKGAPLCKTCYLPVVTCSICNKAKPCYFADTDAPRCPNCSRNLATPEPCTRCGRVRLVRARAKDGGAICQACGVVREACGDCGRKRPVSSRTPEGSPLCRNCYEKSPLSYRECTGCGSLERLYHHGLCDSCARAAAVQDLLADADGVVPARLSGLASALLAGEPLAALRWTNMPTSRAMLAHLIASREPITHEALDAAPSERAARHLRAILVAHGVLPERDEQLAALERWITRALAEISNPEDRRVVQSFATWHHLRRYRRKSSVKPLTHPQTTQARREITTAISLLTWLSKSDRTLETCTQEHIDHWLDTDRAARPFGRTFILWATRNRHCRPLTIPVVKPKKGTLFIGQDDRWTLIRRLLHDDEIDLTARVAGLLLLLFAQPLTRIARITPGDITVSAEKVTLTLGREPLELPPPVDQLVLQLRDLPDLNPRADDRTKRWLFPGISPGTPLSNQALMDRLKPLGIQSRPSRNTTIQELASELPAVVLSKLLGVHITTATRWSRTTGANRTEYAAELSRRRAFRKS
ncbi:hypothetical protein [Streptacidiphilus rugosus]|uniref:hypothetical protein n=1 Tax=Streptacidiphilus rugosus TaxID=405783 RepID=UPI000564771E|nr:hypothetical protein [Streptacidiphilus rugosus]